MTAITSGTPDGTLTTVVGNGRTAYVPDVGQSTSAQLFHPWAVAVDSRGTLYTADHIHDLVVRSTPAGELSVLAGTGTAGHSGDGGPATAAQLYLPSGLAVDGQGNVFISEWGNHRVRKVSTDGTITTVAGNGRGAASAVREGMPATSAPLYHPSGVAVDERGNLYIAGNYHHRVYKVTPDGALTALAGTGSAGYRGDGGDATAAQLYYPRSVEVDAAGNVYLADHYNHRIRRVGTDGRITTVAGNGLGAGSTVREGMQATSALLEYPHGVAVDAEGNVFFGGNYHHRVYRVTPDGVLVTVAGTGVAGYGGDGGQALAGQLYHPYDVALDRQGGLVIADNYNHRVRRVTGVARVTPPTPPPADLYSELTQPHTVPRGREFDLGARIRNRGPRTVNGGDVTVVLTLADGLQRAAGTNGARLSRTFPGAQLLPGEGSLDGTFRVTAPPGTPPGRYTSTLEIHYGGELNLKDDVHLLAVSLVVPAQEATETALEIRQETVPQVAAGQSTVFHLILDSPVDRPVSPGVVTQRYTAPTDFVFTGQPGYGYYSTVHGVITGDLADHRIEDDGKTLVIAANPHVNTATSDTGPLIYTLGIQARAGARTGRRIDGSAIIGAHPPVRIAAEITGTSQEDAALRLLQESVPAAPPGGTTTFTVEIRALHNQPVNPGTLTQRFTAPTGFAFTGAASYGYHHVEPAVTGNLTGHLEDDGRTLVVESNPHLNTGDTDRTALLYTLSVQARSDASPGTHDDGSATINGLDPITLTGRIT